MATARSPFRGRSAIALALAAALAATSPAGAAEPPGAATPQALADRLNAATKAGDLGEIANCLTPDDRAELVLGMVAATGMMVAFMQMGTGLAGGMAEGMAESFSGEGLSEEEKARREAEMEKGRQEAAAKAAEMEKSYAAVLEKHGLADLMSDESGSVQLGAGGEGDLQKALAGVDQGALLEDLMALIEKLGEAGPMASSGPGESPLKMDHELTDLRVQGDRATARAGNEAVEMVRIDGRWYVEASKDEDGGEAAGEDEPEG